uniref:Brinker DNA-binding domain-containing protein n=1 Tax=Apis cerana TaxID=7461 RepID=V9IKS7_APICE
MVHQKQQQQQQNPRKSVGVMGSRRIFAPAFKLKVLDSYRNDIDCRGNQRATARKYGIHRRQIQKVVTVRG